MNHSRWTSFGSLGLQVLSFLFALGLMTSLSFLPLARAQAQTFKAPIPKAPPRPQQQAVEKDEKKAATQRAAPQSTPMEKKLGMQGALDYEYEMKRLSGLINVNGKDTDALYNRAWLYESRGNLGLAEKDYSRVIEIDKEYKDTYYNRGLLYLKMRKYPEAIRDFSDVIKLEPGSADAYCNRGNAHFLLGKPDLALQDYDAAIKAKPNDGDLYYNRGLVHLAKGAKATAMEDFKKAAGMGHPKAKEHLQKSRRKT